MALGLILSLICRYTCFTSVTIRKGIPNLAKEIDDAQLTVADAIESVAILGTLLLLSIDNRKTFILERK